MDAAFRELPPEKYQEIQKLAIHIYDERNKAPNHAVNRRKELIEEMHREVRP
jgi:hypothetical protein